MIELTFDATIKVAADVSRLILKVAAGVRLGRKDVFDGRPLFWGLHSLVNEYFPEPTAYTADPFS
jgi:hypothetical protein